jgi:hypothetical protein
VAHDHEPEPPPSAQRELERYHLVADTVGLVPNIRRRDNLIQAAVVGGGTLPCIAVGALLNGVEGALTGALAGLIVFGIGSGLVLMVVGLIRASKRGRGGGS